MFYFCLVWKSVFRYFIPELPFPLWMTGSVSPIIWPGVCDVCFYPGLQRVLHRIRRKQGGSWVPQTAQRDHCRLWWGNVSLHVFCRKKKELVPFLLLNFFPLKCTSNLLWCANSAGIAFTHEIHLILSKLKCYYHDAVLFHKSVLMVCLMLTLLWLCCISCVVAL